MKLVRDPTEAVVVVVAADEAAEDEAVPAGDEAVPAVAVDEAVSAVDEAVAAVAADVATDNQYFSRHLIRVNAHIGNTTDLVANRQIVIVAFLGVRRVSFFS